MEDQKKLLQFVTWLGENVPELKGQAPEQIVSTINKLSESKEGQQMLQGLIEEFESSMTGMFKKGGKLAYLLCLKKGGNIQDCGCGKKIDKKQPGGSIARMGIQPKEEFTEAEKQALSNGTFYEETTYPGGYYVTRLSSGTKGKNQRYPFIYSKMVAPDGSVLYQQDQYRNYPLINKSPKVIDINDVSYNLGNGEEWFNKYKSAFDGKNLNSPRTKTSRENDLLEYQQGGRVLGSEQYPHATRRDAIDSVMDQMGFSRQQARYAYRNQKAALRDQGFRGNEMRQNARYNMIDTAYPRATEEISRIEPLSAVPQVNMPSNTLVANNAGLAPIKRSGRPDVVTFSNQSFDSAFANARKMGLSEFAWQDGQYDRYSTKLDPEEQSSAQQQEYEYNQQLVENAVNSPKLRDKMKSGILSTLNYPMK